MTDDGDEDGPWGVYPNNRCIECGRQIVVVATVASVDGGYAEAFQDGGMVCMACKGMERVMPN